MHFWLFLQACLSFFILNDSTRETNFVLYKNIVRLLSFSPALCHFAHCIRLATTQKTPKREKEWFYLEIACFNACFPAYSYLNFSLKMATCKGYWHLPVLFVWKEFLFIFHLPYQVPKTKLKQPISPWKMIGTE